MSLQDGGGLIPSTSDRRVENNVMRHEYKVLTEDEKRVMQAVKDKGLAFHDLLMTMGASRELSLAKTKVEEAVMWAVKHLTACLALISLMALAAGCTALHEDVKKVAPLVTQACQALPTIAVSVRMASNYVQDNQIKADLATAALVLSETQKLCPPAAPATTP